MRRILTNKNEGCMSRRAVSAAIAALIAAVGLPCVSAQDYSQQLVPTASNLTATPVSSAVALQYGRQQYATVPAGAVETAGHATTVGLSPGDDSQVQLAAHSLSRNRQNRRQAMYCPPVFNPCKDGCDISFYGQYESLWLDRRGDRFFSLSRGGFIDSGFDFEWGGRYTFGKLFDCVNGWEASFVGPFEWRRSGTNTGPDTTLSPGGIFGFADINTFNNATSHTQVWEAEMYSFELNRKWWVWDVLSTMIGTRYLNYEEDFSLLTQGASGSSLLLESVDNTLAGLQIGGELLYPSTLRASAGIRAKAGVYANFDKRRAFVRNNGTVLINAGDTSVDLAGIIEMALFSSYYITPSVRLTGGYEFWWLPGIATIPEQVPGSITQSSGTSVSNDDSLILHGASAGLQILF
ncbi:MAG: hypothetical protein VXZ82_19460 [Planctomycetota bacterium]|nr:hypothetical protein [Planctomycetota bacterium]